MVRAASQITCITQEVATAACTEPEPAHAAEPLYFKMGGKNYGPTCVTIAGMYVTTKQS
jgi:hypothetical protein